MSIVGAVTERVERPAYVQFAREAVENKVQSLAQGRWVGVDVDMVMITPPDSREVVRMKVTSWIDYMHQQVIAERLPRQWMDKYLAQYEAWKKGEELPLEGTPIKGWGVLSPAQQEMLIRTNYRTVEDLAKMTEEGARLMGGMGAVAMKQKAQAWLAQLTDKGPLTIQMTTVQRENEVLRTSVTTLEKQVADLMARLPPPQPTMPDARNSDTPSISASDLLDDEPPKKGRR